MAQARVACILKRHWIIMLHCPSSYRFEADYTREEGSNNSHILALPYASLPSTLPHTLKGWPLGNEPLAKTLYISTT